MPVVSDAHRAEVRAKILAAAVELIRRDGVRAMTTRAVQEAAGVSTGTIYNYFPSTADLVAAAAQEVTGQDWDHVVGSLDTEADDGGIRQILRDVVIETQVTQAERASAVHLRLDATARGDVAAAADYNRYIVDTISPMIATAQADGQLRADVDVEALVELLDMVRDALSIRAAQDSYATSHERVGAVLTALLEAGFGTNPA